MRFDWFEVVDIALHRLMKWSYKQYRNAIERVCRSEMQPSMFDQWQMNRLYGIHVMFKRLYNGHVHRPSIHSMFLVTMDEFFSSASMLKLLFPSVRFTVGVKNEDC